MKKKTASVKMVIALRHGDYNCDEKITLSDRGREQSHTIAEVVRAIIPSGYSVGIFSSVFKRGKESANIIASHLGVTAKNLPALCAEKFTDGEFLHKVLLESASDVEVILTVGHHLALPA